MLCEFRRFFLYMAFNNYNKTYVAVLKRASSTKSMLATSTFARANALTKHILSFVLLTGSRIRAFTSSCSP